MDSLESNKEVLPEVAGMTQETTPVAPAEEGQATAPQITKEALLDELRALLQQETDNMKAKVDALKQTFYKLYNAEQEALRREAREAEIEFVFVADAVEQEFKQLLQQYKQLRAEQQARAAQEAEDNLLKKEHILQQLKALLEEGVDVTAKFPEFRRLQTLWKEIGHVPETAVRDINKQFAAYQEQFYDLVKINNELREYDFRKNLEAKTQLCEAAEALDDEADVIAAFKSLQQLHDQWTEIGPVARELRESIWARFKEASTLINKKHQDFFDRLHKQEAENLQLKTTLCERIEAIDTNPLTTFKQWEDATALITGMQEEWRKTGFAPRKDNQQIYERYRAACDRFFEQKAVFYKQIKSDMTKNLERKRSLCGEAEALKDSNEWKETTDKLVALQKQWKEVGPVPRKYADELWTRFLAACDYFFERKKENFAGQRKEEQDNLQKKKEIIAQIEELVIDDAKAAQERLRALIAEFNGIGFVPFKEKNKLYDRFKQTVDACFDKLNVDVAHRRLDTFKNNLEEIGQKGANKLADERRRLLRIYDNLRSEIATSENNIGFFSAKSKKSEKLLQEMERKIASLKSELKIVAAKINMIDEKM